MIGEMIVFAANIFVLFYQNTYFRINNDWKVDYVQNEQLADSIRAHYNHIKNEGQNRYVVDESKEDAKDLEKLSRLIQKKKMDTDLRPKSLKELRVMAQKENSPMKFVSRVELLDELYDRKYNTDLL